MDYLEAEFWLAAGQGLFNILVIVWMAISRKHQANSRRVGDLEDRVGVVEKNVGPCSKHREQTADMESVVTELKTDLKHLPSQKDIARVHARMDTVSTEMNQAVGELKATRRQLDIVLEELLRRDKK